MSIDYLTALIAAATLVVLELIYFKIADHFNIIDKPNQRSSHKRIVLRGGGIIIPLSILLWAGIKLIGGGLSCHAECNLWFLAALMLVATTSFVDDIVGVSKKVRLLAQVASMLLVFQQWQILSIEQWWMVLIALFVCTGAINAFNFMDGINGITAGYSLAVLAPLAWVNREAEFVQNDLIIIFGISLLVFSFFNFRKRARCFAGDVGSVAVAFILIFITGSLVLKTQQLWWLMIMALYGIDTGCTIIHRIKLHENLGEAHRKHMYQLMANELKIPHVWVSVIYMVVQLAISAGLIFLPVDKWIYSICVIIVLCATYYIFIRKNYHLHAKYLAEKAKQQQA